jgi:hypothetical protein
MADTFAADVEKWSKASLDKLDLAFRKIALDAFSRVIMRSPVLTGRFRGNWLVSIGQVPDGVTDEVDPSGVHIITDVQEKVIELKFGQTIYLINNLPYARRLEYGWSKQAPGGMVRITAAEFQPIADSVIRQIANGETH